MKRTTIGLGLLTGFLAKLSSDNSVVIPEFDKRYLWPLLVVSLLVFAAIAIVQYTNSRAGR